MKKRTFLVLKTLLKRLIRDRIKFNQGIEPETILLSYYNSISFAFTELCGRSYSGVLEILPGEVGNILVPKMGDIPMDKIKRILSQVDQFVRDNDSIEKALDIVDEEILIKELGVQTELCQDARGIWKKLQRRLKRGYNVMVGFAIDLAGRVKNFDFPKNKLLISLSEAAVNSFMPWKKDIPLFWVYKKIGSGRNIQLLWLAAPDNHKIC
jgi:hypothetical protein